jgi:hypothetical protein
LKKPQVLAHCGSPVCSVDAALCQVGWHHKFAVARFDCAMTVQHLNQSIPSRDALNQPSVVRAIPSVALGLKGTAYSVAIFKYCIAHDVFLLGQRFAFEYV